MIYVTVLVIIYSQNPQSMKKIIIEVLFLKHLKK